LIDFNWLIGIAFEMIVYEDYSLGGGDNPNKTRNLFEVAFKEVSGDL